MNQAKSHRRAAHAWRLTIIALGVLILCSCRTTSQKPASPQPGTPGAEATPVAKTHIAPEAASTNPAVAPVAYAEPLPKQQLRAPDPIVPVDVPCVMGWPGMEGGMPVPYTAVGPWIPPGIVPPWPMNEYLHDGGANPPGVAVGKNGEVIGLQMEDTVAKFTSLDGHQHVEPSNKVDIYSPRFNAVRQVVDVEVEKQRHRAAGVAEPVKAIIPRTSEPVVTNTQNQPAVRGIGTNPAGLLRSRATYATAYTDLVPRGFDNGFRAFENIAVMRTGTFRGSDEPILARGSQAAIAWSQREGVKVILDEKAAAAAVATQKPQETFTIGSSPNPRLRIVKIASTPIAEPGDEVSFTLRFDNVGNQPIGSVQIIDSLTTRLEYVPNSAQCSLKARFATQPNEGESLIVRCILDEPLGIGKGGVFRFRCIVR